MKKKVALLLAVIMLMAMPVSAYAITDAEADKILNDIMTINNGVDSQVITLNDNGVPTQSQAFRSSDYPTNPETGMPNVTLSDDGKIIALNEDGTPDEDYTLPNEAPFFTAATSAVSASSAISSDYETAPIPFNVTPPYGSEGDSELPSGGSYAVSIVGADGEVVWLAYGFDAAGIAAGRDDITGTTGGLNADGGTGYAGFADVTGTKAYKVTVYALSDAPAIGGTDLAAGYSLADFYTGIDGIVIAAKTFSATYTK